jgi:branched-chain amino acid aminotransferase
MVVAKYRDGKWSQMEARPVGTLDIHPAAHVLHYASTCFEGFKAYRWADGSINVFRMDRHIERMRQSARALVLPEPDAGQLAQMIRAAVDQNRKDVPEAPGALYMRPLLFGTTPNIGAAATPADEATLVVLASYVEDVNSRTATQTGRVKTGGNYAAALGPTLEARKQFKADQVLFAPGGEVQETGAANFLLIKTGKILTRSLDSTFLHGVTRDSLLTMARDDGYSVDERVFNVSEMLEWTKDGEAALSGTAAVLAGVGVLIHHGKEYQLSGGEVGPTTQALRQKLVSIQKGEIADRHGWITRI